MKNRATLNLMFNAVGALIGITLIAYIGYSLFHVEREATCRARYPAPLQFSLRDSQNKPLSPIELQGGAGWQEWGVLQNASVVPGGPSGAALQVKLATLTEVEGSVERTANGINFRWRPPMPKATSACLSYSVWLPKGFAFDGDGVLPGLLGGVPAQSNNANRFATRVLWKKSGSTELEVALPGTGFQQTNRAGSPLTPGRWVNIQQEIVLNSPSKADGMVRMWVDGKQNGGARKLTLRKDPAAEFLGVSADIGYLRDPAKAGELRISPFLLSWR